VAALLVAADVGARVAVEEELRRRVAAEVPAGSGPVDASVRSFPFLGRLLLSGRVGEVRASVAGVEAGGIRFLRAGVTLSRVRVDRDRLVRAREVVLEGVGEGIAFAEIGERELERLLGVPVSIGRGRATVTVEGVAVTAEVRVDDGVVRARVAGLALPAVPIPQLPFLPCVGGAELGEGRLRVTCRVDEVPPELLARVPPVRAGG
jgi:hypothetical protein